MGSGQSARKLTITNEEEIGVIKVSNAVVQRLAQKAGVAETSSDTSSNVPIQHSIPSAKTVPPPQPSNATPGYPAHYYPELTMSAHRIQQQKEQELMQQEQYWQRRLQNLDESYQKINHTLESEYKKAADETSINKAGQKITNIQNTVQPCLENSNKVLKCFQDYPKETLKCSNLVEEFSNCVWNVHYTRVIDARS